MHCTVTFPAGSPGVPRRLEIITPIGHLVFSLDMKWDTTCCSIDAVPRNKLVLKDGDEITAQALISKSVSQDCIIVLKCPEQTIAAPATPQTGKPQEQPAAPVVQTPAQRLASGLRPTLVGGKIVWQ